MNLPTHAQPTADRDASGRDARVRRGADLCRRDSALWHLTVRYQDQLEAAGVAPAEAHEQALRWAGV